MSGNIDRKVLHEFLERKGFNFAEDLDLALLDRQHRKIPELAETPAQQPRKKKRKPDILRILEGDEVVDGEGDAESQESIPIANSLRRRNSETARMAKAAWAQEAQLWEQEFRLARNDVDKAQNMLFKETFIRQTKNIYSEVDRQIKQRQQQMNFAGVFHPEWNAVRAESKKRVLLAKNLNYDEIRRNSSRIMLRAVDDDSQGEEKLAVRQRTSIWKNDDGPKEPTKVSAPKTLRQRQKDALSDHMNRRNTEVIVQEDPVPHSGRRDAGYKPQSDLSHIADAIQITSKNNDGGNNPHRSTSATSPAKSVIASLQSMKADSSAKAKVQKSVVRMLKSIPKPNEVESTATHEYTKEILHATPAELLEVEDLFAAKRRDIRSRSAELNENLNAETLRDKVEASSPTEGNISKSGRTSTQNIEEPDDQEGANRLRKSYIERIGFFKDESDSSPTHDSSSEFKNSIPVKEMDSRELSGHIQVQPEFQSHDFMSVVFSELSSKKSPPSATTRPAPNPLAPQKTPRRTRYLQPMSFLDSGKDPADPPSVEVPPGLQPFPGTRALNPFYTTFTGPSDIMLQAARSKLTPRIATAKYEEAMQPPTPRTVLQPIYRPDHEVLRIGTPDLDDRLKKEMAGLSLHMPMPTFVGDVDLMKLVGNVRTSESSLFGPVPTNAKRSKQPRRKKDTEANIEPPPPEGEQKTAELAKSMMLEESAQFVRGISEADQKIMKEERAGPQPPAPLNDDLAQRLEAIWEALEMPLKEKLGILVKYSAVQSVQFLSDSIEAWEEAARCVGLREEALIKLIHGMKLDKTGTADHSDLREKVSQATTLCSAAAEKLLMRFGDVLTFRGMPYIEELEGSLHDSILRVSGVGVLDAKKSPLP